MNCPAYLLELLGHQVYQEHFSLLEIQFPSVETLHRYRAVVAFRVRVHLHKLEAKVFRCILASERVALVPNEI